MAVRLDGAAIPDVEPRPIHDRRLLLGGAKRNAVLELWEVQQYGADSFGDADYVSLYGMRPADWYARGIRVLGRTAVECTRDVLARAIGRDVAALAGPALLRTPPLVVDPFAGSGNTLFWILRHLPGARGLALELDAMVFALTTQNLRILGQPLDVVNTDAVSGCAAARVLPGQPVIVFIAPPWGEALDRGTGLDLRRTMPPIVEIVGHLTDRFARNPLLCAIQIYERVEPGSLAAVRARFDWSASRIFALNAAGENHGILLGTRGWVPREREAAWR